MPEKEYKPTEKNMIDKREELITFAKKCAIFLKNKYIELNLIPFEDAFESLKQKTIKEGKLIYG